MSAIKKPALVTDAHLEFLDGLRESGVTNMFGAGSYLKEEFGVNRAESHTILCYWMKLFAERHPKEAAR